MWSRSNSRDFVSQSLRRLRRRVLDEGQPLFRVLSTFGRVRDFVSERLELDGVHVLVRSTEVSWSVMGGLSDV